MRDGRASLGLALAGVFAIAVCVAHPHAVNAQEWSGNEGSVSAEQVASAHIDPARGVEHDPLPRGVVVDPDVAGGEERALSGHHHHSRCYRRDRTAVRGGHPGRFRR